MHVAKGRPTGHPWLLYVPHAVKDAGGALFDTDAAGSRRVVGVMVGRGRPQANGACYAARIADPNLRAWIAGVVANPSVAVKAQTTPPSSSTPNLAKLQTLDGDDDDGSGGGDGDTRPDQTQQNTDDTTNNADGSTTTNNADGSTTTNNADGSTTTNNADGSTTIPAADDSTDVGGDDGSSTSEIRHGRATPSTATLRPTTARPILRPSTHHDNPRQHEHDDGSGRHDPLRDDDDRERYAAQPFDPGRDAAADAVDRSAAAAVAAPMQDDQQKQQMERQQILQDTQTKTFEIDQDVTVNKPQTADRASQAFDNYIRQ